MLSYQNQKDGGGVPLIKQNKGCNRCVNKYYKRKRVYTHPWKGMVVVAFGSPAISMVDNLPRPLLLGQDVQMHPLMIFLSILGGITLFNFSGFVLGPVITSLLFAVWKNVHRPLSA
jgi:predicted PurR-regulated permease PerM